MELLIDTSILIEAERGRFDLNSLADKADMAWICGAGVAEYLAGEPFKDEGKRQRWRAFWLNDLSKFPTLPLSPEVCERAGALQVVARSKSKTVPLGDALHGGVAAVYGLTVATLDTGHFRAMGLETCNPAEESAGQTGA